MSNGYRRFLIVFIGVLSAFLIVAVARQATGSLGLLDFIKNTGPNQRGSNKVTLVENPHLDSKDVPILDQLNAEYTKISASVMPSIVSISTTSYDRKLRDRFGRSIIQTTPGMDQGSGVIVSKEGHVLTNYHVIANLKKFEVRLADGKTYPCKVIGIDPRLDIAVLKVLEKGPFEALAFGDSDKVREGNIVFAFGNPFGIGKSLTQGVISARERSISDAQGELFQSSAAINPGYSGGPLVNIYGEIIGINSSIFKNSDRGPEAQGISFSIPSNIVHRTFLDIIETGKPRRGYLGVFFTPITSKRRAELDYSKDYGALIADVGPMTPASKAGLRANDIILNYDHRAVRDPEHLIGMIKRSEIGKPMNITLWRNKQEIESTVVIDEFDQNLAKIPASQVKQPERIIRNVGIAVTYLTSHQRRLGISGVRVARVLEQSSSEGLIKPNDIIYQVNQYRITQPNQFYDVIEMYATKQDTQFFIIRNGVMIDQPVTLPKIDVNDL